METVNTPEHHKAVVNVPEDREFSENDYPEEMAEEDDIEPFCSGSKIELVIRN